MNNHLRDIAKKRFKVSLDALPEREQRVVQHFGDRQPVSHHTNLGFDKKLTFGQRLAIRRGFGGSLRLILFAPSCFLGAAQRSSARRCILRSLPYILLNLCSHARALQAPIF